MAEEQEQDQQLDDELDLGIEKGGNKKLIIIIAGAVLLLALIGGGVWFFLSGDEEAPAEGEEVAEESAEQSEEEAEAELLPPIYHSLKPVFVVNLPPGGDAKMLQIGVDVMLRQPELQEFLKHNDPMVRDRLLTVFGAQDSKTLRSRAGKEKLQGAVQKELEKIVQELGGSGKIESVYFTSFVMQ